MIKRIAIYFALVAVILLLLYSTHAAIIDIEALSFSLLSIYIFNTVSSVVTYIVIELTFTKLPDQTGYAFLAAVFLKLGLFTVIFMTALTSENPLEMSEKISILIPFGVFLMAEAGACFRLLNTASNT